MAPCSAVFTAIGVYAYHRKKPMWFWSGSTVEESEIADIPAYNRANGNVQGSIFYAYNRANGRMWIIFSLPLWLSTLLGLWSEVAASILLTAGFVVGLPLLVAAYRRIYEKYKA